MKVALINPNAKLPVRKGPREAGVDVFSCEEKTIPPLSVAVVSTGIKIRVTPGFVVIAKARGRHVHLIGSGVIDETYQGEIFIRIFNTSSEPMQIAIGDSIAQLVQVPVLYGDVVLVDEKNLYEEVSERGASGGIRGS